MDSAAHGHTPPSPLAGVYGFIIRRAAPILGIVAALTVAALTQLIDVRTGALRIAVDPSLDPLIARNSPSRQYLEQVRQRFGSEEPILVVLEGGDAYARPFLERVDRLSRKLAELPGITRVRSITTVPLARVTEAGISADKLHREDFADPGLSTRVREAVVRNPLLLGHLMSRDGRAAAVVVSLEAQTPREILDSGVTQLIVAAAEAERAPGIDVHVTGGAIVREATSEAVMSQLAWVIPAIVLLLAVVLALTFRSVRGVLLPLATITIAIIWTFALMTLMGRPLNLITSLVPPLLVTMGLAYCAHVLSEFETLARQPRPLRAPQRALALLNDVAAPVLLTGFTTAVGLLALVLNDLPAIREFAALSALGVIITLVLVLTFLPATLCYVSSRPPARPLPGGRLFDEGSRRLGEFDTRHRVRILWISGIALILSVICSGNIKVGDEFVGIFAAESRVRQDYEAVTRALGGVHPLLIVIDAEAPDTLTEPSVLKKLDELETWLAQQPEVGAVTGIVDHIKVLHGVMGGGTGNDLPQKREMVKQLLFFGDRELLRGVIDSSNTATLIALRLRADDSRTIDAFLDRLGPRLQQLPRLLRARITGDAALMTESVRNVTIGQLQSIALALALIYLCLAVQFASFKVGLLASLPTLLQTALYFGAMGVSGVMLNATTSLVECLVLGLAVDDTIHYLARFNTAARRSGSESAAAVSALTAVLRPVTLTKAVLAIGFLILATGELRNQVMFGALAAFTLFAAWLVDVFVTPAFVSGLRVVTMWDSLRLDLGQNVQGTIPLFTGLTARQARIFALMANLETFETGQRIMSEGDEGGDVFVVIDGELAVWVERGGQRRDVARLKRGAVLGEGGYFGTKRTASVDALSKVRLLRFNSDDQESICRTRPHIAARVFLNLNRIQAERRQAQMQAIQ